MTSWDELDRLREAGRAEELARRSVGDPELRRRLRFEEALESAVRAAEPIAPDVWAEISRRLPPSRRARPPAWRRVRAGLRRVAAGILFAAVGYGLWRSQLPTPGSLTPSPGAGALLLPGELVASVRALEVQSARHTTLAERLYRQQANPRPDTVARTAGLPPLAEEVAFLDAAIAECQEALNKNPRHRELRARLEQLAERRNALLEALLNGAREC